MTFDVVFYNGPLNRHRGTLSAMPPQVQFGFALYDRIDDPDTGEPLGGYIYVEGT